MLQANKGECYVGKLTPKQLKARLQKAEGDRATWESHWQEVADYILPDRNDVTVQRSPGEKRNTQLFDSTGIMANELLAGSLHGLLTNPNTQWFGLTTGIHTLDEEDDVRFFLQEASRVILNIMNNSNFQTEVHELYLDLTSFGTACQFIEEDEEDVVRFSTRHIREVFIAENSKGMVNEIIRCFKWTAEDIVNEFGQDVLEKLPQLVQKAYKDGTGEKFKIIHAVYEQSKISGKRNDKFKFASQYVLDQDAIELSFGGFREMPYAVPRWSKVAGETYGRGPGMKALPDVKTLNKMTETVMRGALKTVDPPLQAPDEGFVLPLITRPAGVNYYRAGRKDRIEPIFNDARIDFGFEAMRDRGQRIREAFYVDKFQLQEGPQMTATEVMQRTEEQTRLLGPLLGRMSSEYLRPMIKRVFAIALRRGLLPDIPEILEGRKLDVQYSSVIARSQRVSVAQNIQRTMEAASMFISLDPTIADIFNGDNAAKEIARIYDFPQGIIRTKVEVDRIRSQRAEQQAQQAEEQQALQTAEAMGKVAPALGQMQGDI
jgi:hypothetical protein